MIRPDALYERLDQQSPLCFEDLPGPMTGFALLGVQAVVELTLSGQRASELWQTLLETLDLHSTTHPRLARVIAQRHHTDRKRRRRPRSSARRLADAVVHGYVAEQTEGRGDLSKVLDLIGCTPSEALSIVTAFNHWLAIGEHLKVQIAEIGSRDHRWADGWYRWLTGRLGGRRRIYGGEKLVRLLLTLLGGKPLPDSVSCLDDQLFDAQSVIAWSDVLTSLLFGSPLHPQPGLSRCVRQSAARRFVGAWARLCADEPRPLTGWLDRCLNTINSFHANRLAPALAVSLHPVDFISSRRPNAGEIPVYGRLGLIGADDGPAAGARALLEQAPPDAALHCSAALVYALGADAENRAAWLMPSIQLWPHLKRFLQDLIAQAPEKASPVLPDARGSWQHRPWCVADRFGRPLTVARLAVEWFDALALDHDWHPGSVLETDTRLTELSRQDIEQWMTRDVFADLPLICRSIEALQARSESAGRSWTIVVRLAWLFGAFRLFRGMQPVQDALPRIRIQETSLRRGAWRAL